MITLALMGDVMLGRKVAEALSYRMRPDEPWGDVMPLLNDADLRLANLECAITDKDRPWIRTPKVFHFRTPPSAVETLWIAGSSMSWPHHIVTLRNKGCSIP